MLSSPNIKDSSNNEMAFPEWEYSFIKCQINEIFLRAPLELVKDLSECGFELGILKLKA